MIVLNVGGGPSRNLPPEYAGWEQHLLDIDPAVDPDICCDARVLADQVTAEKYDAIYCSHNMEHYYAYDVPRVLAGFRSVLKVGGFVDISVPDVRALMQAMLASNLDINDVWYRTGDGLPITFHDVLYGWGVQVASGNHYYAHKCGFTRISLAKAVQDAGFSDVQVAEGGGNLRAKAWLR